MMSGAAELVVEVGNEVEREAAGFSRFVYGLEGQAFSCTLDKTLFFREKKHCTEALDTKRNNKRYVV